MCRLFTWQPHKATLSLKDYQVKPLMLSTRSRVPRRLLSSWHACIRCERICLALQRLSEVGTGLRGIGSSMFTGTRELLEHITEAISSELDSIEGMAARNKPQQGRPGSRCIAILDLNSVAGTVHACSVRLPLSPCQIQFMDSMMLVVRGVDQSTHQAED
jgi:hypothetical protein